MSFDQNCFDGFVSTVYSHAGSGVMRSGEVVMTAVEFRGLQIPNLVLLI